MRKILSILMILSFVLVFAATLARAEPNASLVDGNSTLLPSGNGSEDHVCITLPGYEWCESESKCINTLEEKCANPGNKNISNNNDLNHNIGNENDSNLSRGIISNNSEASKVIISPRNDSNSSRTIVSRDNRTTINPNNSGTTVVNVTVDENGISVENILVKSLPSAVFEHNKNLERNANRIISAKLEKSADKNVYVVEYTAKRKLFGFISANAKQIMIVDVNSSQIISEKKPWWRIISTESKDEPTNDTTTQ